MSLYLQLFQCDPFASLEVFVADWVLKTDPSSGEVEAHCYRPPAWNLALTVTMALPIEKQTLVLVLRHMQFASKHEHSSKAKSTVCICCISHKSTQENNGGGLAGKEEVENL